MAEAIDGFAPMLCLQIAWSLRTAVLSVANESHQGSQFRVYANEFRAVRDNVEGFIWGTGSLLYRV